jgi:hypothetical protein
LQRLKKPFRILPKGQEKYKRKYKFRKKIGALTLFIHLPTTNRFVIADFPTPPKEVKSAEAEKPGQES